MKILNYLPYTPNTGIRFTNQTTNTKHWYKIYKSNYKKKKTSITYVTNL